MLLHILLHAAASNSSKERFDLGDIDARPANVAAEVDVGLVRYVRLNRLVDNRMEYSSVVMLRPGDPIPPGWTSGTDVTQRVMASVGLPPKVVAAANQRSKPIKFPPPEIPVRWQPRAAALAAVLLVGWTAVLSYGLYRSALDDYPEQVWPAVLVGLVVYGMFVFPPALFAAIASGLTTHGGPLHRRPVIALGLAALLAVPCAWAHADGSARSHAELVAWRGAVVDLDLAGPDRSAGFATVDPLVPGALPPEGADPFRAWAMMENIHPAGVPRYGPGDHGVVVDWAPGAWDLSTTSLRLPPSLRATGDDDVAWIAYVSHARIDDAFQFSDGTRVAVGWVNLRVVDRATGQLVSKGASMAAPPRSAKNPSSMYDVSSEDEVRLIEAALRDSYAR